MNKMLFIGLALIATAVSAIESTRPDESAKWNSFKTASGIETRFSFQNDSHYLYLKIICLEPEMKNLKTGGNVHDVDVWKEEHMVEIFLNPVREGKIFAQFAVGPAGTMYDSRIDDMVRDPKWNPQGIEATPFREDSAWGIALKFPIALFVSLFPDAKEKKKICADSWSFNIVRNRRSSGKTETASFSKCGHWLEKSQYTPLTRVTADYPAMLWNVNGLALTRVKPGNQGLTAEAEYTVDNISDKMRVVKIGLALSTPQKEKTVPLFEKKVLLDKDQIFRVKETVPIPASGPHILEVSLSDSSGNPLGWSYSPVDAQFIPMRLEIVSGAYRGHDIFSTMNVQQLVFKLTTGMEYKFNPDDQCILSLTDSTGKKELVSKKIPASGIFDKELELDLPKLAPGDYTCNVRFTNPKIPSAQTALAVHPKAECEIYINENGNFVRNGKEFFPIGGFGSWWTWDLYPNREMIDFAIAYGPANDPTEYEKTWYADARSGWRTARFPEPRELWSHTVGEKERSRALRPIPPENSREIAARIRQYRGKDYVFGWYLADEPSETKILPQYLKRINQIVHEEDPYHPTILCFNSSSAAGVYGSACDTAIIDYFPGFHESGREQPLSTFVSLLEDSARKMGGKKPLIAAPPLYAYAGSGLYSPRFPNYLEQRCMSFTAMTCDEVRGFCWNDVSRIGMTPEIFFGAPAITKELRHLEKVWLSRELIPLKVSGKDASALRMLSKIVNGELYIVSVNPTDSKIRVSIALPEKFKNIHELAASEKSLSVKNGIVSLEYTPLQARIFTSDPNAPRLEAVESVLARIRDFVRKEAESGNLCHISHAPGVIYSPLYKDTFGIQAYRNWLTDGLFTRTYRAVPNSKTDPEPWLGIEFKRPENVSRFEIGWKLQDDTLSDQDIIFKINVFQEGKWTPIPEKSRKIQREGTVLKAQVETAPAQTEKFRIVFGKQDKVLISPCELRAFR